MQVICLKLCSYYVTVIMHDFFNSHITSKDHTPLLNDNDEDSDDNDMSSYYRQNCNSPGRILYTVSYYSYYITATCILLYNIHMLFIA